MKYLCDEIANELKTAGLVRRAWETGSAPACWVEETTGAPAPTAAEPVTLHVFGTGGMTPGGWQDQVDIPTFEVHIRAVSPRAAETLGRYIKRALLAVRGRAIGSGLHVHEIGILAPLQRLGVSVEAAEGYLYTIGFVAHLSESAYGD